MYVCICNAVTEQAIRAAAREGVQTMKQLREALGVATCCGRCAVCARNVLKECHATCLADLPAHGQTSGQEQLNPPQFELYVKNTASQCC